MPDTFLDLFWGYTAFWVIIAAYVVLLMSRQRHLQVRLEELSARLERRHANN